MLRFLVIDQFSEEMFYVDLQEYAIVGKDNDIKKEDSSILPCKSE